MRKWLAIVCLVALGACNQVVVATPMAPQPVPTRAAPVRPAPTAMPPSARARTFISVVDRVMPIAQRECRARRPGVRCDYAVVVDDRPGLPANAFQTLAPDGQPIVGFTLALIADARNPDEMAFILSHEAAHHIEGHIDRGRVNAATGAVLAGAIVALGGADQTTVQRAQNFGAFYGSRRYSQDFELEADALATRLTRRAGYDPLRGVEFFFRAPDPGDRFLGSHPPNAARIATVRRVAAGR
ncbi:peptidase M48-like protein [Palleronia aestuarii]|uniref:Peptidase M48-like protein n=1 Tax=Palleronia aestuarii TaxID=568105 RepID=A0A2W7NGT4_9RHOB|nr:M48 family metallopeptidase [Palleronia aestuarii]PZX19615.1 peptidase M48-like protein [Palleronia aestuarii]